MRFEDDLNDPLAELFGGSPAAAPLTRPAPPASYTPPTFTESCKKCRGSGNWRPGYPCFACQGRGQKTFKTAPQTRAKARERAVENKMQKLEERHTARTAWEAEHKAEMEWLRAAARRNDERNGSFDFPLKMINAVNAYCSLTENQLAAVRKLMLRDTERKAERAANTAAAPSIDVTKIEAAFAAARTQAHEDGAEGVRWLKLRLDTFQFLDMPARGQWKAAIRVTEGDLKLGRIEAGKFIRFSACTDEHVTRILAAAADPLAAAKAYGLRFSSCSCCGRELTDPDSIRLGIGPICAEKWFCV